MATRRKIRSSARENDSVHGAAGGIFRVPKRTHAVNRFARLALAFRGTRISLLQHLREDALRNRYTLFHEGAALARCSFRLCRFHVAWTGIAGSPIGAFGAAIRKEGISRSGRTTAGNPL